MIFRLSPRLRMILTLVFFYFAIFAVLRAGFYFYFLAGDVDQPASVLWKAYWIGLRFDLRIAVLVVTPLALLSVLPRKLALHRNRVTRIIGRTWLVLATLACAIFYIADFAHYSYLGERINVSVLRFLEDGADSFQMVWESYPVVRLFLLLLACAAVAAWLGGRVIETLRLSPPLRRGAMKATVVGFACVMVWAHAIIGKVGSTMPLRWGDAFFANDQKVAALALNPMVYFFDTMNYQTRTWDKELLAQRYRRVAEYLGVDEPGTKPFNFVRRVPGDNDGRQPPNVVLIHLESLGANRMGLFGNPLEATPTLDRLGREGYFFPNFMVPSSGTARTVFGLITGIPDISWGGTTATRNPQLVEQYTLVNAFTDYEKLYFLGGSAGWANVKGVLEANIDDLELWEEGDYEAPEIDVWGISDRSLFKAAHNRLVQLDPQQPFVAFIQTAGNHRPFTIPDDDSGFEVREIDEAEVQKHSFLGADQYNAVRLLDYNIRFYLEELVEGSWYEDNTIFILYGDHNDRSESSEHMGYSEVLDLDKHHVPLIIYGPGVLNEPRRIERPASLVDILPTALGIAGLPYENRTLGRDLLSWNKPGYALTFGGDRNNRPTIGLLGSDFHLSMFHDGENVRLYSLEEPVEKEDVSASHPDIVAERKALLEGLYQSARYLMLHNRRDRPAKP